MKKGSGEWEETIKAFEKWASSKECRLRLYNFSKDESPHATYSNGDTESAWQAWLAGMSFMRLLAINDDFERFC